MPFDVIKVHRGRNARLLIEVQEIALQVRIIHDPPQVALEVPMIDGVEAHQRAESSPVRFHDVASEEKPSRGQARFQLIQRREQPATRLLVGGLRAGEPGLVNPVVDALINETRQLSVFAWLNPQGGRLLPFATVAGVPSENVDVTFEDGVLSLTVKAAPFERQGKLLRQERPWGNWSRKLELPKEVQPDAISADVEHGVLRVTVPKAAQAQPVRIPVGSTGERRQLKS